MKVLCVLALSSVLFLARPQETAPVRPSLGKPEIMKIGEVKAGMKGHAWTVFEGTEPEPVPVEIVGVLRNAWGPKQDIILGKMTGRALRTNVAGGMSGSPVYVNGKLVGAVSLRISVFSPDSICGITPIELMLEVNDFDSTRPAGARTPDTQVARNELTVPEGMLPASAGLSLVPIETPLMFSGFTESTMREFGPMIRQMGLVPAQGGAAGALTSAGLAANWKSALQPGEMAAPVLVSGDMSVGSMCTVTYNDGSRVLVCGHQFLNLGPVTMPMAKGEVLMTLASQFQPTKIGNATEVVGAFKQDRHSAVLGVLGESATMIPCRLKVRTFGEGDKLIKEKDLKFEVFEQQKWTPFLMMATLFNSISGLNDFAEESTYRLSGSVELEGQHKLSLSNIFTQGEVPTPAPMLMAGWWGDKFNRLFLNAMQLPKLKSVEATLDLLPQRRLVTISNAWAEVTEVEPGSEVPVRVFLQPYRGERIQKEVKVQIPAGFPQGDHRILISDADTLNRMQTAAGRMNRFMDIPQTVSLINQERSNNKLYVSLVQRRPTVYYDDKTLPSLPASVANVLQGSRSGSRSLLISPETAQEQMAVPFDLVVAGSYSLNIKVN